MNCRVYIYGDSNTYGYDPFDWRTGRLPEGKIWTTIVRNSLPEVEFAVDGLNGRELPNGRTMQYLLEDLARTGPFHAFVMMLGSNDAAMHPGLDEAELKDRYLRTIEAVRHFSEDKGWDLRLLLIGPPPIRIPELLECSRAAVKLNAICREAAEACGAAYFDAAALEPELIYDGIHLSERGHRTLGEAMTAQIGQLLDLRNTERQPENDPDKES